MLMWAAALVGVSTPGNVLDGYSLDVLEISARAIVVLFILGMFRGWIVVRTFYTEVKEERDVWRTTALELKDAVAKLADKDDAALKALQTVADEAERMRRREGER